MDRPHFLKNAAIVLVILVVDLVREEFFAIRKGSSRTLVHPGSDKPPVRNGKSDCARPCRALIRRLFIPEIQCELILPGEGFVAAIVGAKRYIRAIPINRTGDDKTYGIAPDYIGITVIKSPGIGVKYIMQPLPLCGIDIALGGKFPGIIAGIA